jgi:hypothetical protein
MKFLRLLQMCTSRGLSKAMRIFGLSLFFLLMVGFQASASSERKVTDVNEQNVQQEEKTISGKVTDSSGESLPGVSVFVKGTTNGTITDVNGNFSLKVPLDAAAIVVSFIGMETKEYLLKGKTVFNIVMLDMVEGLEEVVVVGYGTQKKLTLTASVSQIDAEIFEDRPTANAFRSLQGAVPGLVISNSA